MLDVFCGRWVYVARNEPALSPVTPRAASSLHDVARHFIHRHVSRLLQPLVNPYRMSQIYLSTCFRHQFLFRTVVNCLSFRLLDIWEMRIRPLFSSWGDMRLLEVEIFEICSRVFFASRIEIDRCIQRERERECVFSRVILTFSVY